MELTMLSWALYFIDVVENLKSSLVFFTVVGGICSIVGTCFWLVNKCEEDHRRSEPAMNFGRILMSIAIPMFLFSMAVNTVLPTKETMRMIVGIEAANAVAQTDEAKEMLDLVKSRIKKSLEN